MLGLVEYALIISLVAIIVFAAVQLLGPTLSNTFSDIDAEIEAVSYIMQML
ncbi:MAG: pilus assembly protein [Anaerolineae bacterium]|nr:pilus assembly protein [Anaerolineae bacterium]MBT7073775.1 pilus assembly protein [Anaerolineae bacterium]MBT7782773.1 pilus assembly protein [Anaerolineae bacterium]